MNTTSIGYPVGTKLEGRFTNAEAYVGVKISPEEIEQLKRDWMEENKDVELSPGVTWETDTKQYSGKIVSAKTLKTGAVDYGCLFDTPSKYSTFYRGDAIESVIPSDSEEEGSSGSASKSTLVVVNPGAIVDNGEGGKSGLNVNSSEVGSDTSESSKAGAGEGDYIKISYHGWHLKSRLCLQSR